VNHTDSIFDRPLALLTLVAAGALGCASTGVKPGDMSAEEHEAAAAGNTAEAGEHADRFEGKAVRYTDLYPAPPAGCDPALPGSCSPLWTMTKNPTDRELSEAAGHLTRARQHRKAARTLREAEARACAQVAPADRDMSPFARQSDIRQVEEVGRSGGDGPLGAGAGAMVAFLAVPGLSVESLQRIVDCHLARDAALGFDQRHMSYCPLNVRGARAQVKPVPAGLGVFVTSTDAAAALEIVRRARALASEAQTLTSQC
jgi:hypothetical protein